MGLIGFTMIHNSDVKTSTPDEMAAFHEEQSTIEAAQVAAETSKPVHGKAPFSLPSNSSVKKEAPSRSNPRDKATLSQEVIPPAYFPTGTNDFKDAEISNWHEQVKNNPRDASARKKLAHAYLMNGDSSASIEQFYCVMKLRNVETSEIIAYADNLMTFASADVAKQFLTSILTMDPMNSEIRTRLKEIL